MFYKHAGEDRDLHILDLTLTICSMVLSGFFGYVIGEGMAPLNWVLATVAAGAAYCVSMWFKRASYNRKRGEFARARRCLIAGFLCLGANVLFDFASAAALRDQVATKISNTNVVAGNREKNLQLVDDEIASIKGQLAWKSSYSTVETYEAEISNLTGAADIMKRSKECSDQTRPDTKEHCSKLAAARGNLAGIKQKKLLDSRLEQLIKMREGALTASETNQHKSNAAAAVIRMVGALALQKEHLTEVEAFWVGLALMLLMTALINASLYNLATELGEIRAANEGPTFPEAVEFNAPRLTGPTSGPGSIHEPIPLRPVDPHANLVVINGQTQPNSSQADQLMAAAMAALKRYETSPFAQQEGKA